MEPLLTTEDVANFLRVDVVTVRRLVAKSELPAYRVGGEYRFRRAEIEEYVRRQRVNAVEDSAEKMKKFEEFEVTERARRVLAFAYEESRQMRHEYVGTEHLLLGLMHEKEGIAGMVLKNMGVGDVVQVRDLVGTFVAKGTKEVKGKFSMTRHARKALGFAGDEAKKLNHRFIGTEHILLGMVREGEGLGVDVLKKLNVDVQQVHIQILMFLQSKEGGKKV